MGSTRLLYRGIAHVVYSYFLLLTCALVYIHIQGLGVTNNIITGKK